VNEWKFSDYDDSDNTNVSVYGAIIMTMAIVRVHMVHLVNTDSVHGGRQPSDKANQLGFCL